MHNAFQKKILFFLFFYVCESSESESNGEVVSKPTKQCTEM